MRNLRWIPLLMLAAALTMNISCKNHDLYNLEITQVINDSIMPIDSVDKFHNWLLFKTATVAVKANDNVGAQWVKILTADPRQATDAEVASQAPITDGGIAYLSFCYPSLTDTLYAALVSSEGLYTVASFIPGSERQVDFSNPRYRQQVLSYNPQPQVFVFCYEEEMPDITQPDFDYNDIVLHLSYERTGMHEMRFHVQLAAVGTDKQVAAAIHLKNIKKDDIESITTVGDASFNQNNQGKEVPNQILSVQKDRTLLLEARNSKDAVINMFCDGHWATGDILTEDYGRMQRKRYNVTKSSSTDAQIMVPREVTYVVTFKDNVGVEYITFDVIDPFIMKQFLGAVFEVHPYAYRSECVLSEYPLDDRINRVPWSLTIPYGKFRHPLEGVNIGFKKKETLGFGAYGYTNHSFGEWSMDHTLALDWYLNKYATGNQVY